MAVQPELRNFAAADGVAPMSTAGIDVAAADADLIRAGVQSGTGDCAASIAETATADAAVDAGCAASGRGHNPGPVYGVGFHNRSGESQRLARRGC